MRQILVTTLAQRIGAVFQQAVDIAAVGIVAGRTLLAQLRRMFAAGKIGALAGVTRTA